MDGHWRDEAGPEAMSAKERELADELEAVKHREHWNDELQEAAISALREIVELHERAALTGDWTPWIGANNALAGLACSRLHVPDQGK